MTAALILSATWNSNSEKRRKKHMKSNKELVYFVGKDKNDVNGEHCSLNILNI